MIPVKVRDQYRIDLLKKIGFEIQRSALQVQDASTQDRIRKQTNAIGFDQRCRVANVCDFHCALFAVRLLGNDIGVCILSDLLLSRNPCFSETVAQIQQIKFARNIPNDGRFQIHRVIEMMVEGYLGSMLLQDGGQPQMGYGHRPA